METESSNIGLGIRKSTRYRKKRKLEAEITQDDDKQDDNYCALKHIVKKPQRKRGKAGKLAGLIDLPLDVLFEIFGHLRPFDLLRLARMTKQFRRLLMHKSSISVWKAALEKIAGLPSCPPSMDEPQWVNLVFDPHCHFCFTNGVRAVEWGLRVRICAKCAKDHIKELYIPNTPPTDFYNKAYFPFEMLVLSRLGKRLRRGILVADYENVKAEYEALESADARKAYVLERRRIITEIEKHAKLCHLWAQNQTDDRSFELSQLRDKRRLAIIAELRALGWQEDLENIRYPDALEKHELVRKPQLLTDRIWANIKGPIIQFMEEMRAKRLAREHAALVLQRKKIVVKILRTYKNARLPVTEIFPEILDFCEFPPIKAILGQPVEVTVDESSFSTQILSLIPDLIENWRKTLDHQLTGIMRIQETEIQHRALMYHFFDDSEDEGGPVSNEEDLAAKMKLATTVFRCKRCPGVGQSDWSDLDGLLDPGFSPTMDSQPLFYPRVLGHLCLTRITRSIWDWDAEPPEPVAKLDFYQKYRRKWKPYPLVLDQYLGKCIESIITTAEKNPATTTAEEMNSLDLWFACLTCPEPIDHNYFTATAFGWREAAIHHEQEHYHKTPKWHSLSSKELRLARRLPFDSPLPSLPDSSWLCAYCRDSPREMEPVTFVVMQAHLLDSHDIPRPEINVDYYRDFGAQPPVSHCDVTLNVATLSSGVNIGVLSYLLLDYNSE